MEMLISAPWIQHTLQYLEVSINVQFEGLNDCVEAMSSLKGLRRLDLFVYDDIHPPAMPLRPLSQLVELSCDWRELYIARELGTLRRLTVRPAESQDTLSPASIDGIIDAIGSSSAMLASIEFLTLPLWFDNSRIWTAWLTTCKALEYLHVSRSGGIICDSESMHTTQVRSNFHSCRCSGLITETHTGRNIALSSTAALVPQTSVIQTRCVL